MITVTNSLIILTALVWVLYDIYLFRKLKRGEDVYTISMVITAFSKWSLPFVFLMGFLMGHWFWPA